MKTSTKTKFNKVEKQLELNFSQDSCNIEKNNCVDKIETKIVSLSNYDFKREIKDFSKLVITQTRSF
ncbi:MAG: hypothetical protein RIS29_2249 [Bacteroidota bacterium]|jgi:hypothetical protein